MKRKLFTIFLTLTAMMAVLMISASADYSIGFHPAAADGYRCTGAILYRNDEPNTKSVLIYDIYGNLTEKDDYSYDDGWSSEPTSKTVYSYTAAGLIKSEDTYKLNDDGVYEELYFGSYTYDEGRLVKVYYGEYYPEEVYTYDSIGRVTSVTYGYYGLIMETYTYTYDSLNRIASASYTSEDNSYETPYTYDGDMLISDIYGTYSYNSAGQCIGVDSQDGITLAYDYDAAGNRIRDTQTTSFITSVYAYTYEEIPGDPFQDVSEDAYYYTPVLWAADSGITAGTSETTFSPDEPCTRGQVVTFLWRAAGSPKVTAENPFSDVKESDYFYHAVLWAVKNGITAGTTKTTFGPADPCTRGQVVTFMYRNATNG